jgi:hypothetical protein
MSGRLFFEPRAASAESKTKVSHAANCYARQSAPRNRELRIPAHLPICPAQIAAR